MRKYYLLTASVTVNLLALGYFKYANFGVESLSLSLSVVLVIDGSGGSFKGETCFGETRKSTIDADAGAYGKGKTSSELRFMGHTLADNRCGLISNAMVTTADRYAEREAAKAMIHDASQAVAMPKPRSRWAQTRAATRKSSLMPASI